MHVLQYEQFSIHSLKDIGSEAALAILTGMKTMATVPRME